MVSGSSRLGVARFGVPSLLALLLACAGTPATDPDDEPSEGGTSGQAEGGSGQGGSGQGGSGQGGSGQGGSGEGGSGEGGSGEGGSGEGGSGEGGSGEGGSGEPTAGSGSGGAAGGSGGTPASAGGTGGTTPGTGGKPPPPVKTCTTNLLCDDFEKTAKGQTPEGFKVEENGGTKVLVDDTRAFSGSKSVKINVPVAAMGAEGSFRLDPLPSQLPDAYMRMMVYLESKPVGTNKMHWTYLRAVGSLVAKTQNKIVRATTGIGGHPHEWQETQIGLKNDLSFADCWNHTSQAVPTGKWACVEYHLKEQGDLHEVWVDGTKIGPLSYSKIPAHNRTGCQDDETGEQLLVPTTTVVTFGWRHAHGLTSPLNMWIDDVAVDNKRIGCPQK